MATKKKEELGSSLLGVSENTARNLANYQAGYQEGERVQNAYNEYNNLKQNAPQAYVSPYQQQLDDIYAKITNRQPFKYNLNGDMLYQNAKEQYQQLGKQAMVDTIGQATQLTGGYGNSYAQNAGNQAYQQYLLKLNEQIPDYYRLAMERYNQEGDQLNNAYALARDRENDNYNRYRDTVSDYNQNLQMAYNIYGKERDNDYGQYADALNYWQNMAGAENSDYWKGQNFDYQKQQDALAQQNWEREMAFKQMQYQNDLAYKYAALNGRGGSGGTNTNQGNGGSDILRKNGNFWNLAADRVMNSVANAVSGATGKLTSASNDAKMSTVHKDFSLSGLTGNTNADIKTILDQLPKAESVYTARGRGQDFAKGLNDTLEYYYYNGDITLETAEEILKKYGLK